MDLIVINQQEEEQLRSKGVPNIETGSGLILKADWFGLSWFPEENMFACGGSLFFLTDQLQEPIIRGTQQRFPLKFIENTF